MTERKSAFEVVRQVDLGSTVFVRKIWEFEKRVLAEDIFIETKLDIYDPRIKQNVKRLSRFTRVGFNAEVLLNSINLPVIEVARSAENYLLAERRKINREVRVLSELEIADLPEDNIAGIFWTSEGFKERELKEAKRCLITGGLFITQGGNEETAKLADSLGLKVADFIHYIDLFGYTTFQKFP